jgi:hypothetical protein
VLTVDENREQTRAIHRLQRELRTREGYLRRRERDRLLKLHQNAQRLLRRLPVFNPYARRLTFLDDKTRTRRDHDKYLDLIESIALLHQHQRPLNKSAGRRVPGNGRTAGEAIESIDVTPEDIAIANRLADEVLGRSLDELPPQTRRFLGLLEKMVDRCCEEQKTQRDEFRFSRKDARECTGWTYFQVRVHLDRLVELEYVLAHRGGRGQSFKYELLYDGKGKDGKPFMIGLFDVDALCRQVSSGVTTESLRGAGGSLRGEGSKFEASLSPHSAPFEPRLRGTFFPPEAAPGKAFGDETVKIPQKTRIGGNGKRPPSNRYAGRSLSAAGAAENEAASFLAAEAAKETLSVAREPWPEEEVRRVPDPGPRTPDHGRRALSPVVRS